MADDLEARLQSHAKAFEGLMSLLPPDLYYGKQGTENEWMKKKQTKEEKKAARKAKLNPNNHKTAKDVADERDKKRRLEDEELERAAAGLDGPIERPGEGIKAHKAKVPKTAKSQDVHSNSKKDELNQPEVNGQPDTAVSKEEKRQAKEAKRKEKRAAKVAKEANKKAAKKARKEVVNGLTPDAVGEDDEEEADEEEEDDNGDDDEEEADTTVIHPDTDMDRIDMSGLVDEPIQKDRASSSRSASPAPEFSPYHNERSSSTSSIAPDVEDFRKAAAAAKQKATAPAIKSPAGNEKHETAEEAQARRAAQSARLQELLDRKRKERNADGLNGKPARSRTELIEARRQKEQQRKEKKKEVRAQEREALKKAEMEAHLASLRGSPALGSELFAPRSRSASVSSPGVNNNSFSFGRVAFTGGARINSSLSGIAENTKKAKGPSDTKTALLAAEKHQARLNGLDATKRADLEEKDVWLNARKRINGEKILDDVNLLRKSLKRKEKAKKASEKAWGERTEGVKKSQEARQKKREENIAKRREEKGGGGKKKGGTGAGVKKKKGGKPGFR